MTNSLFLNVRILSPLALIFEGEVDACLLPTPQGPTKILPRHMATIGRLRAGQIDLTHEDGTQSSHTVESSGFYRIIDNTMHIWMC